MQDGRIHLSSGKEDGPRQPPAESLFLAYAAMAPLAAGALGVLLGGSVAALALRLTLVWAGALVCFLSGVRRGYSFRQVGGPRLTELAAILGIFALGFASLAVPSPAVAAALQILGFAAIAIYDPIAARRGEAPRHFEHMRPAQMAVAILSLACVFAVVVWRG